MIKRIKSLTASDQFHLLVTFDDGKLVEYDVSEDIDALPGYSILKTVPGLFSQVCLDESRTCVSWAGNIDLPSDIIYEYGKPLKTV